MWLRWLAAGQAFRLENAGRQVESCSRWKKSCPGGYRPEQAIRAVADTIGGQVWLQEATRPIGSFLFLGPTGVGKSSWPGMAEFLFNDKGPGQARHVRIHGKTSVAR